MIFGRVQLTILTTKKLLKKSHQIQNFSNSSISKIQKKNFNQKLFKNFHFNKKKEIPSISHPNHKFQEIQFIDFIEKKKVEKIPLRKRKTSKAEKAIPIQSKTNFFVGYKEIENQRKREKEKRNCIKSSKATPSSCHFIKLNFVFHRRKKKIVMKSQRQKKEAQEK